MNNEQRKDVKAIASRLEDIGADIEEQMEIENEKLENMGGFAQGETGEKIEEGLA